MEVILDFIKNNIVNIIYILVVISILGLVISDIIRMGKGEITHKKIVFRSNYFRQVLLSPIYLAIALFGVLLIVYSLISFADNKIVMELVVGLFGGLILSVPFFYLIMSNITSFIALCHADYVILEDTLKDKYKTHFENNEPNLGTYKFYFEKLFTMYNLEINVSYLLYKKSFVDDKFYIVVCNGEKMLLNKHRFYLSKDLESKIIKCNDLEDYMDVEKVEEESPKEKKEKIDSNIVVREYLNNGARNKLIRNILIILLLFGLLLASMYTKKVILFIIVTLIVLSGLIATCVSIFHIVIIINKINNGNYEIKKDSIKKMNKYLRFKESNKWIILSFDHYKKDIYVTKKEFSSANEKDEVFLIFIKGEYEPLVFEKKEYKLK